MKHLHTFNSVPKYLKKTFHWKGAHLVHCFWVHWAKPFFSGFPSPTALDSNSKSARPHRNVPRPFASAAAVLGLKLLKHLETIQAHLEKNHYWPSITDWHSTPSKTSESCALPLEWPGPISAQELLGAESNQKMWTFSIWKNILRRISPWPRSMPRSLLLYLRLRVLSPDSNHSQSKHFKNVLNSKKHFKSHHSEQNDFTRRSIFIPQLSPFVEKTSRLGLQDWPRHIEWASSEDLPETFHLRRHSWISK